MGQGRRQDGLLAQGPSGTMHLDVVNVLVAVGLLPQLLDYLVDVRHLGGMVRLQGLLQGLVVPEGEEESSWHRHETGLITGPVRSQAALSSRLPPPISPRPPLQVPYGHLSGLLLDLPRPEPAINVFVLLFLEILFCLSDGRLGMSSAT